MNIQLLLVMLPLLAVLHLTDAQAPSTVQSADPATCQKFSDQCDFEFQGFEGEVPIVPIGEPADTAITTRIISKDATETLGILNSNGIAPEVINSDGVAFPITAFGNPPFTPSHAKPFPLPGGGSGIGHQVLTGNQLELAKGDCIRVFFSSYQVIVGPRPRDVINVNAEKKDFKCVVFFTE